jgi:hypothetical protein
MKRTFLFLKDSYLREYSTHHTLTSAIPPLSNDLISCVDEKILTLKALGQCDYDSHSVFIPCFFHDFPSKS